MLELREFAGSPEELQRFIVGNWTAAYRGKMAFPLWTPEYFAWQLGMSEPDGPIKPFITAAYVGQKLVGVLPSLPMTFRTPVGEYAGSQGSWLTIDPEFKREGTGAKLRDAMRQSHRERGLVLQLGYGYFGSKHSQGPKFWKSQKDTEIRGEVGFWARVLDWRKAAAWDLSPWQARAIRWFSRWQLGVRDRTQSDPKQGFSIRAFQASDLDACLELLTQQLAGMDLSILWTRELLARHLQVASPLTHTLVAADSWGKPAGFVNFHILPFMANGEERVGIIDLAVTGGLTFGTSTRLIESALAQMLANGAVLGLKLRGGDSSSWPYLRAGFVPRLPDSYLLLTWSESPRDWTDVKKIHLLWR